jgi:hypothetical protein
MEKLSKKDTKYQWNYECHKSLDILKEKMVTEPILVFLDWLKEFHVHVDAFETSLGEVLTQPREGDIDHPIDFASRKLLDSEKTTILQKEKV